MRRIITKVISGLLNLFISDRDFLRIFSLYISIDSINYYQSILGCKYSSDVFDYIVDRLESNTLNINDKRFESISFEEDYINVTQVVLKNGEIHVFIYLTYEDDASSRVFYHKVFPSLFDTNDIKHYVRKGR